MHHSIKYWTIYDIQPTYLRAVLKQQTECFHIQVLSNVEINAEKMADLGEKKTCRKLVQILEIYGKFTINYRKLSEVLAYP